MQLAPSSTGLQGVPSAASVGAPDTSKLFVGGLPQSVTSDALHSYFLQFGVVTEVDVKCDPQTGRSRGFGFVTFADPSGVENALGSYTPHQIEGNWIEVKRFERPSPNSWGVPDPQGSFQNTSLKMCRHFFAGRCSFGEQCRFSHDLSAAGGEAFAAPGGADAAAGGGFGATAASGPTASPSHASAPTRPAPATAGTTAGGAGLLGLPPGTMEALGNALGTLLASSVGGGGGARPAVAPAMPALPQPPVAVPAPAADPTVAALASALTPDAVGALTAVASLVTAAAGQRSTAAPPPVAAPAPAGPAPAANAVADLLGKLTSMGGLGGLSLPGIGGGAPPPAQPQALQRLAVPQAAPARPLGGGAAGDGSGVTPCRHFLQGRCNYGDACRFPHVGGAEGTIPGHPKANTLFLGGLPRTVTEAALMAHLSQFGTVRNLEIKRDASGLSRGFGFADFLEDGAADAALAAPQGHAVEGRAIEVRRHFGSSAALLGAGGASYALPAPAATQPMLSLPAPAPALAPVPAPAPAAAPAPEPAPAGDTAVMARTLGILLASSAALGAVTPSTQAALGQAPPPQQAGPCGAVAELAQTVASALQQQVQTAVPTAPAQQLSLAPVQQLNPALMQQPGQAFMQQPNQALMQQPSPASGYRASPY